MFHFIILPSLHLESKGKNYYKICSFFRYFRHSGTVYAFCKMKVFRYFLHSRGKDIRLPQHEVRPPPRK